MMLFYFDKKLNLINVEDFNRIDDPLVIIENVFKEIINDMFFKNL